MSLITRENQIGLAKASQWGQAVEPGLGDGIWIKSFNPPAGNRKMVKNDDEFGRGMATTVEALEYEEQTGSMSMRVYYESLEKIITSLMGKYTSSTPETGVTRHIIIMSEVIDEILHTFAYDEGDEIKVNPTIIPTAGTFSYDAGLNLDIDYTASGVSIAGTLWTKPLGVTYPSDGKHLCRLVDCKVYVNNFEDPDFTAANEMEPSGMTIGINRGHESTAPTAGKDSAGEPFEKNAPFKTILLNFPKKTVKEAAYFNAFKDKVIKKMRIKFTGPVIEGSGLPSNYEFILNFPRLYLPQPPDIKQETPYPTDINFESLKATTTPAGMVYPLPYIIIQNKVPALTGYPAV
jgi:hypothetical protein